MSQNAITDADELSELAERVLTGAADEFFAGDESAVGRLGVVVLVEAAGLLTGERYENETEAAAAFLRQRRRLAHHKRPDRPAPSGRAKYEEKNDA